MNAYLNYIQEIEKGHKKRLFKSLLRRILFRLLRPYFEKIASLFDHANIDLNQTRGDSKIEIERIESLAIALQNRLNQIEKKIN